ncbi:hypothetical protein NL676_034209 [Syzygium grande]|nr:hypothetical protein NL676_034209 [Syzygium grande]
MLVRSALCSPSIRSVLSEQESLAQSRAKLAHGPATSSGTPRWRCRCLIRCVVPGSTWPRREFGRDRVRESSIKRRVSLIGGEPGTPSCIESHSQTLL